jgi:hypothetical protein
MPRRCQVLIETNGRRRGKGEEIISISLLPTEDGFKLFSLPQLKRMVASKC